MAAARSCAPAQSAAVSGGRGELPFPGGAVNSSSSVPKRIFKQLPQQQFLLPGQEQPLGGGAGPFPCDGSRELQCRSPSSPAGFSPQRLFVYFGLLGFLFFFSRTLLREELSLAALK